MLTSTRGKLTQRWHCPRRSLQARRRAHRRGSMPSSPAYTGALARRKDRGPGVLHDPTGVHDADPLSPPPRQGLCVMRRSASPISVAAGCGAGRLCRGAVVGSSAITTRRPRASHISRQRARCRRPPDSLWAVRVVTDALLRLGNSRTSSSIAFARLPVPGRAAVHAKRLFIIPMVKHGIECVVTRLLEDASRRRCASQQIGARLGVDPAGRPPGAGSTTPSNLTQLAPGR